MSKPTLLIVLAGLLLFIFSCSTSDFIPVVPEADTGIPQIYDNQALERKSGDAVLWGYYDIYADPETMEAVIVPNRGLEFAVNIIKFLNNNPAGLQIDFGSVTSGTGYTDISLNVGITHPLDIEKFNGYDVKGVFIGNASGELDSNNDLIYGVDMSDQTLLNADGYTRWFNPGEFTTPGIFGYTKGNLASAGYTATATLNPYKYFGQGLDSTGGLWNYLNSGEPEAGYFLHGTTNVRNYQIRFPVPNPGIKFSYAIVAHWAGGDPQDHPAFSTETPAIGIIDHSDLWYVDSSNWGGNLWLDLYVFDRGAELVGGVMEEYQLVIESSVLLDPYELDISEMTPVFGNDNYHIYEVSIPADNITSADGNNVWVIAEYPGSDYSNPFGVPNSASTENLGAYFNYPLIVENQIPMEIMVTSPDGGEEYELNDQVTIQWTSDNVTGDVSIEYSKDNFSSDFQSIALHTENDGNYLWSIPADYSETVKVRVTSDDFPGTSDTSNNYFTILAPSVTVLTPNGGEFLESNNIYYITWTTTSIAGNVDIKYSTDNFVSDVQTVALDTDNDGTCTWNYVPCDYSSTVKVRIYSTDNPLVYDTSDNYFTIIETGWARAFGGLWYDRAQDVATDVWDNIFVCGSYGSDAEDTDPFIFKFNSCGALETYKIWGGTSYDSCSDIAVDHGNNVYICGYFMYTVDFDPGNGVDEHTSHGSSDFYVSKFNNNLEHQWTITIGGTGSDKAYGLCIDSSHTVWVTGYFNGSDVNFDPDDYAPLWSEGDRDVFVAHYDGSGNFLAAKNFGGWDNDVGNDIAVDSSDNVYITGTFEGIDADFDPSSTGSEYRTSEGEEDAFLNVLSNSGSHLWTGTWGGIYDDEGNAIAIDGNDVIYVTGAYANNVDFDPDTGTDYETSEGGTDIFITAFDDSGSHLGVVAWGNTNNDYAYSATCDGSNNLYITGRFFGTTDFDTSPGSSDFQGPAGAFLTKYNAYISTLFSYGWSRSWGYLDDTWGMGVTTDSLGNSFTVGKYMNTVDFAYTLPPCNDETKEFDASGEDDVFLVKRMPDGCW